MKQEKCPRCGWLNRIGAKLRECLMCGYRLDGATAGGAATVFKPRPDTAGKPGVDHPAIESGKANPGQVLRSDTPPGSGEHDGEIQENLSRYADGYLAQYQAKQHYFKLQLVFTGLVFAFLVYSMWGEPLIIGLWFWLILAVVVLFGIKWVINEPNNIFQLGCLWITIALSVAWFVGLSLLDIYSVAPAAGVPGPVPPVPVSTPLSQSVAPVTWIIFGFQALLSAWLVCILARDVRARQPLKD